MTIYNEEMREMVKEIRRGEEIVREFFEKTGGDLSYYKKGDNPYYPYDPNGFLLIWKGGILKVSFSGLFVQEMRQAGMTTQFECSKKLYLGLRRYLKRVEGYEKDENRRKFCIRFKENSAKNWKSFYPPAQQFLGKGVFYCLTSKSFVNTLW